MEPVNKLPGLTFTVVSSTRTNRLGKVELHADVNDEHMWDAVVKKMDGQRVYTVDDIATSVMEVLQNDIAGLREKLRVQEHNDRQRILQLEHDLEELRNRNTEYIRELSQYRQGRVPGQTPFSGGSRVESDHGRLQRDGETHEGTSGLPEAGQRESGR